MKHTIQAGVVSPFPMALDPNGVDFSDTQSRAIEAVYAKGCVALWDGTALSFVLDPVKASDYMAKFDAAWQSSKVMASLARTAKLEEAKRAAGLDALIRAATGTNKSV